MRDKEPKERIQKGYTSSYRVYGARKIRHERQGHAVTRCTVERLMRELDIQGAVAIFPPVSSCYGKTSETIG